MSKRVSRKEFIEKVDSICGVLTTEEISKKLGKSKSEVLSDIENNKVLAIEDESGFVFPAFQVVGGEILEGMGEILNSFDNVSVEGKCTFFLNPLLPNSDKNLFELLVDKEISVELACVEARGFMKMGG